MQYQINQRVKTPIGDGIYQGMYRAVMSSVVKHLVRLPVNEQTVQHLQDESCVTPRATHQALFAFTPRELGRIRVKYAVISGLVLVVVWLLGKAFGWPI